MKRRLLGLGLGRSIPAPRLASDDEHRRRYATAIQAASAQGPDAFQRWFDDSLNAQDAVVRGYWDLSVHILTPKVVRVLSNPGELTALEIGYGGGRLLNAACSYFKWVTGVDVHAEAGAVTAFLGQQRKTNFTLLTTEGTTIDVEDGSVDFVYSFIVLQHLTSYANFAAYLRETARVLRTAGVAQLYFGAYRTLRPAHALRHMLRGYVELPDAPVNHTSLVVRMAQVRRLCRHLGLRVIDQGCSYKRVPDGFPHLRGGQDYVTLLK